MSCDDKGCNDCSCSDPRLSELTALIDASTIALRNRDYVGACVGMHAVYDKAIELNSQADAALAFVSLQYLVSSEHIRQTVSAIDLATMEDQWELVREKEANRVSD